MEAAALALAALDRRVRHINPGVLVTVLVGIVAATIVIATWVTTRKDQRYQVASGERDEYKARAERLAESLLLAQRELDVANAKPDLSHVMEAVDDLRESLRVHSGDPSFPDRRRRQIEDAPRRRLTDA